MGGFSRFSPRELAWLRVVDAKIEAEFKLTAKKIALGNRIDQAAKIERMDASERAAFEQTRQSKRARREYYINYKKQHYQKNKDYYAEYQRARRRRFKEMAAMKHEEDGD